MDINGTNLCLTFFHLLAQKLILEKKKKKIFKQNLSKFSLVRIMFYLFWASGKWVSTKTVEQLKLINKTQVTKKKSPKTTSKSFF